MRQFFLGSVLAGLVFCIGCAEESATTIDSNLESADYEAQMIEGATSETEATPAGDASTESAPVEAAPAEAPAEATPAEAAPAEAPAEAAPAEAPTE